MSTTTRRDLLAQRKTTPHRDTGSKRPSQIPSEATLPEDHVVDYTIALPQYPENSAQPGFGQRCSVHFGQTSFASPPQEEPSLPKNNKPRYSLAPDQPRRPSLSVIIPPANNGVAALRTQSQMQTFGDARRQSFAHRVHKRAMSLPGDLGRRMSSFTESARRISTITVAETMRSPVNASISPFISPPKEKLPIFQTELPDSVVDTFLADVKAKQARRVRHPFFIKYIFPIIWHTSLLTAIYLIFVGLPIWNGFVYTIYLFLKNHGSGAKGFVGFFVTGSTIMTMPILTTRFEPDPKPVDEKTHRERAKDTALIIPAHKAAGALPQTIEAALHTFQPHQIFVIDNGRTPEPSDNTREICQLYGVRWCYVPIGSKIIALFIGTAIAKKFKSVLLTDDDVRLPPAFPVHAQRLSDKVGCVGYTIASTGPNGSKGSIWQQSQDLEYKLSGLTRCFGAKYGSAEFPHGAIMLWDREFLLSLFYNHPGFSIGEDYYLGHICRCAGRRVDFCSEVFVQTETPQSLMFPPQSGSRGGYGELTIFKQRFYRWEYFRLFRLRDNLWYLLFAWRLGHREVVSKYFAALDMFSTTCYIFRLFVMPITFIQAPQFAAILTAAFYALDVITLTIFNGYHLRRKNAMVDWNVMFAYFWLKTVMVFANTAAMIYAAFDYATYFAKVHTRIVDDYEALEAAKTVIRQMDEEDEKFSALEDGLFPQI